MSENTPVATVDRLSVSFDPNGKVLALAGLSFEIMPGEIVGVVGESGCGKSLTAMSIMGLLPGNARVTGGRIVVDGVNVVGMSERALRAVRGRRVGMVFQEPMVALNPLMRVGRQVAEVLEIHSIGTRRERKGRALQLLKEVGLTDAELRYRQYPHQLSGGMRQRVMIAIALAAEPVLVVADEPTTALDTTVQSQILDLFNEIRHRRKTAILLVTHDMGVVAEIADRVIVMYAGRVVEVGAIGDIFHRSRHPYTSGLLASIVARNAVGADGELKTISGRVPSLGEIQQGCPFAPRCPSATERCREDEPMLVTDGDGHGVACWHPNHVLEGTVSSG